LWASASQLLWAVAGAGGRAKIGPARARTNNLGPAKGPTTQPPNFFAPTPTHSRTSFPLAVDFHCLQHSLNVGLCSLVCGQPSPRCLPPSSASRLARPRPCSARRHSLVSILSSESNGGARCRSQPGLIFQACGPMGAAGTARLRASANFSFIQISNPIRSTNPPLIPIQL